MASIVPLKDGTTQIKFIRNGEDLRVRLGRVSSNAAHTFKRHIEHILAAKAIGDPIPLRTAEWVGSLSPKYRRRLADKGLVSEAPVESVASQVIKRAETIGELCAYVLLQYEDHKASTQKNMRRVADALRRYFGDSMRINEITKGDVKEFRRWLVKRGALKGGPLAITTASEIARKARTFFVFAVDKRWIPENPFSKLRGLVLTNKDNEFFVHRKVIKRVMRRANPDLQVAIALGRYGGVRSPSEVRQLELRDVDWDRERFTVREDEEKRNMSREVPIFPELRPYLEEAFERAPAGEAFVCPRYARAGEKAIYSAFRKLLIRCGVTPWPRLLQNLRSSRETELIEEHPAHVVTSWIGHDITVARANYLQITDEHFAAAVGKKKRTKKRTTI